jgi:putative transcriptional regulator
MTIKKFKSDILESVHASAVGLLKVGAIDKQTMRQFDERCLVTVPTLSAQQIKKLRIANKISQPIFARYLNTSTSTVQKWESGAKQPSGMALKLLSVVKKHGLQVLA